MDRTMTGLLGAVGALVASTPCHAAPSVPPHSVLEATSYADLLRPIPNALETLKAIDAAEASVQQAQYYPPPPYYYAPPPPPPPPPYYRYPQYHDRYYQRYYHHHHHHHDYYRRW